MVDFDDLLILTNMILDYEEVLDYYQNIYKYILVDEFQDTNAISMKSLKNLPVKTIIYL